MGRVAHLENIDIDRLGEQALRETKEERDLHQRLKEIEEQLDGMAAAQPTQVRHAGFLNVYRILRIKRSPSCQT